MFLTKTINALRGKLDKKAVVLCYHRIAKPEGDPWNIAVSKEHFEEQLSVLQKQYNVVSIPELLRQLHSKTVRSQTVCISFDDGYTDNYLYAKPLLEKYNLPATFFIPSKFLEEEKPFWWDELEAICLDSPQLPKELTVNICGKSHHFINHKGTSLTEEQRDKHKNWNGKNDPPTARAELYLEIWKCLRPLAYKDVSNVMDQLREWSNFRHSSMDNDIFSMSKEQLTELASSPLFTIGMHTDGHPSLAYHSYEVQKEEIVKNQKYLKDTLDIEANYIAYPYGSYNNETLQIVKELNIGAAFTTKRKPISKDSDTSELGRFYVKNWNAKQFRDKLQYWFRDEVVVTKRN